MLVKKILLAIPNDITVKDAEDLDDPRLTFILDEYERLIEQGVGLEPYTEDTTFGEIKDNLAQNSSAKLLDFLLAYHDEFMSKKEKSVLTNAVMVKSLVIYSLVMVTLIMVITLIMGVINGDFSTVEILQVVFNFLSELIKSVFSIFSGPEQLPY